MAILENAILTYRYIVTFTSAGHVYGQPHVNKCTPDTHKHNVAVVRWEKLNKLRFYRHGDKGRKH